MTQSKKTIAFFYPCFLGGGAESVALWMMQALCDKYDITLFTISKFKLNKLDLMYGTSLSQFPIIQRTFIPEIFQGICYFLIANNKFFRNLFFHFCLRNLKLQCYNYDLVISGYNGVDLGKKGIQYIHWTKVITGEGIGGKISNFSEQQIHQNISLVNSSIVAKEAKKVYNVDAQVIYPPVVIEPSQIPWEEKENAFICSGRIVKAKEPHRVISILKQVREKGFDVKLYMTGGGGGVYEWQYQRFIRRLIQENSSWITLYNNLPYPEYVKLLSRCKYGIHFKKEPFGISIAEMVKAGAIPFVRSVGGQIEIVGQENQELFFDTEQEAVDKIIQIFQDGEKKYQLREKLKIQQHKFSTEKFMLEIANVVESYFYNSPQILQKK
ncbi:glycosyltransferase [Calothrix sp. NIES-3974]|uniref:glycosyltransferase n=1 Tax=Calothrix sp. NIES-3974 TaxID=2005462 RepID=UPI000B5FA7D1|nr:glycosyltransferase [Calothrix sp. NIES-3974]BAZ06082.1 group 1 glycosyl transferase [Calothrix sp. NIES-3974]